MHALEHSTGRPCSYFPDRADGVVPVLAAHHRLRGDGNRVIDVLAASGPPLASGPPDPLVDVGVLQSCVHARMCGGGASAS